MKYLIFASLLFLAFLSTSSAQQHRFSIKDRVAQLKDSLALSDTQSVAVDSILTNAMDKARNLDITGSDRRQAMMQIMKQADIDIENILTPDQKTKYEAMQAERRSRMQSRMNKYN